MSFQLIQVKIIYNKSMLTKFNSKFFIKSFSHIFFSTWYQCFDFLKTYLHSMYQFSTMYMYQLLINFNSDLRQNIRY
jgi:hypothetical protein